MPEGQTRPEVRFEDIARLNDLEVQRLLRKVDSRDIAGALKGAAPEVQDRIFSNVSERVRQMIQREMDVLDPHLTSAEEPRGRMVRTMHQMIQKEEIGYPGAALSAAEDRRKRERQERSIRESREKLGRLNRARGPGLDLSTVAGLGLGILVVAFGLRQGGSPLRLGPAAGFVLLGALAVVLTSGRAGDLPGLVRLLGRTLFHRAVPLCAWMEVPIVCAELARREGVMSLKQTLDLMPDPFIRGGIECAIDGIEPHVAREFLEVELRGVEERHQAGHALMATAGVGGGLFGGIGLLLGLTATGGGIGAAFFPLLWGSVVWGLCYALRLKLQKLTAQETLRKRMAIVSVFELQHGTHPTMLRWALTRMVAPRLRADCLKAMEASA